MYVQPSAGHCDCRQAARCGHHVFGGDYLIDDGERWARQASLSQFQIEYLGDKRDPLPLEHANPASFDTPGGTRLSLNDEYYYPGSMASCLSQAGDGANGSCATTYINLSTRQPAFGKKVLLLLSDA